MKINYQAWYMRLLKDGEDQRKELQLDPPKPLTMDQVTQLTGVLHHKLDIETCFDDGSIDEIKKERGYSYEDVCEISPITLPDYDNKIKSFFEEHLHTDEEIRFIEAGSGYFDVRTATNDDWIRIKCGKGDLIVLPAGIYHRFTLDTDNYIKARRYFVGEPVWTAYNRPEADKLHSNIRSHYLKAMRQKV